MNKYDKYELLDWINIKDIDWKYLSSNRSPGAIELLNRNIKKIDWCNLSENPSALDILVSNSQKIQWGDLINNDNIEVIPLLEKKTTVA